ncbi:MAG: glyoxylate/hydroxypyruvate reductase A [Xanthomonadales bacterium]|nr:glyoxylate/hydroxypyruvate reductase A [Xanthomonadales bacterium]
MALAIVIDEWDTRELVQAIGDLAPDIPVQVWPDIEDPEAVRLGLVWGRLPEDLFVRLPNMTALVSAGAGVDRLLSNEIPAGIRLGRLVLRSLATDMTAYCLGVILHRSREFDDYAAQQARRNWLPRPPLRPRIGILGMGQLGSHLAARLLELDFPVCGWRLSAAGEAPCPVTHGEPGLIQLAEQSDFLVCLLPLTSQTRGVLSRELFRRCRPGAYLINAGRGGHLVDGDLLEALERGWLSGACLDVFEPEPLPADHPFWGHPAIRITPHVASPTNQAHAARAIVQDYRRLLSGQSLTHGVDRERGY